VGTKKVEPFKCAFNQTLIGEQFGCENAQSITRREGPDVCCTVDAAQTRCAQLRQRMKEQALPAFDMPDDLLQMPHSMMVKIEFGGLLALQGLVNPELLGISRVENISKLVDQAIEHYGDLEAIPYQDLVDQITSFKLKRRKR
jgi:hypothetical protein